MRLPKDSQANVKRSARDVLEKHGWEAKMRSLNATDWTSDDDDDE